MRPPQTIPFDQYLPDQPETGNPGLTVAKNCIPAAMGYRSLASLSAYSTALTNPCQGGVAVLDADGNVNNFVGDSSKLYRLADTTFNDVSGSTYTTASDDVWEFTQYGSDVMACNGLTDEIQVYTMGTSSAFSNLGGSPPRARHITTYRDFVVTGNTYDTSDGSVPYRVRWSALGNNASWAVSATTQADFQDLNARNGWVNRVVGQSEYATVIQDYAITRMTYIGSPVVMQFDTVEQNRGTLYPQSVVAWGRSVFYLADDGFYMFDGTGSQPIGAERVDKTFFNDFQQNYKHQVWGAADPINKVVFWVYPGAGSTDGTPNKAILFNWDTNKWSTAEFDAQMIFRAMSLGYTLDGLDDVDASLDALTASLDSRQWMGGQLLLACFDTDNKLAYLNGTALDATFETKEFQLSGNNQSLIQRVRPVIDGSATVTVQAGVRDVHSGTTTFGAAATINAIGDAAMRSMGRYHKLRVNTSGSFEHAQGVDVYAKEYGFR
jgi:hypothetical protein